MNLWTTGPAGELVLEFYAPTRPLSINRSNGLHWGARRNLVNPWRDMALLATLRPRLHPSRWWSGEPAPLPIQLELPFRTRVRPDPHN